MSRKKKRIGVALSGGIDSSAALWLLKEIGYDVAGFTMCHFNDAELGFSSDSGIEATKLQAKKVCDFLGVAHYAIDLEQAFKETVMQDFVDEYQRGRTPNPCTLCNRTMKWGRLLDTVEDFGFDMMATGHYIRLTEDFGIYHLYRSADIKKDQSYMLWQLNQKQLAKTLFPLAEMSKDDAREIIIRNKIPVRTDSESQEICFISGHYRDFLSKHIRIEPGNIVLSDGKIIGRHHGLPLYTIGQRKGIQTSMNEVLFVQKLDMEKNQLVVTSNADDLLSESFMINKVNWTGLVPEPDDGSLMVQIRYNSPAVEVEKLICRGKSLEVKLKKAVRAITPGQSAVFYKQNELIGGGVIL